MHAADLPSNTKHHAIFTSSNTFSNLQHQLGLTAKAEEGLHNRYQWFSITQKLQCMTAWSILWLHTFMKASDKTKDSPSNSITTACGYEGSILSCI